MSTSSQPVVTKSAWPLRAGIVALLGMTGLLAMATATAEECRPVSVEQTSRQVPGRFEHGLLWKIETSTAPPSYLFGTFHSSDPRITTLPCPVLEAFNRARSYSMEVIANGAGIVAMAEAMFLPAGQSLRQLLGDPLFQETLRATGMEDDAGSNSIDRMKPWAVMMMLAAPRKHGGLFLDMALQLKATRQGKETYGLETMPEQIAVFNGMPIADQIILLEDAIRTAKASDQMIEELAQAYLRRDLSALLTLQEKYKSANSRIQSEVEQRLLTHRNRLMAERMQARLKEGNAFIAVGALHLPGKDGLLNLLAAAGYRLSVVY